MKEIKVKLTFTEPILGTSPANPDVYREFIGSKSPDALSVEDEVAALGADAVADKGMTVFPRLDDGTPFLYDYQIKGFFKDTCGGLRKVKGTAVDGTARAMFRKELHWRCEAQRRNSSQRRGFVEHGKEMATQGLASIGNGVAWHCGEQRRNSYAEKR